MTEKLNTIVENLNWNMVLDQLTYNPKSPLIFSS